MEPRNEAECGVSSGKDWVVEPMSSFLNSLARDLFNSLRSSLWRPAVELSGGSLSNAWPFIFIHNTPHSASSLGSIRGWFFLSLWDRERSKCLWIKRRAIKLGTDIGSAYARLNRQTQFSATKRLNTHKSSAFESSSCSEISEILMNEKILRPFCVSSRLKSSLFSLADRPGIKRRFSTLAGLRRDGQKIGTVGDLNLSLIASF